MTDPRKGEHPRLYNPNTDPVVHAQRFSLLILILQFATVLLMGFFPLGLWAIPAAIAVTFATAIIGIYEQDITTMKERARASAIAEFERRTGFQMAGYIMDGPQRGERVRVWVTNHDAGFAEAFPDLKPPAKHEPGRE